MRHQQSTKLSFESLEHRQMLSANGLNPFSGDSVLYQIHGRSGDQGQLSEINIASGAFTDLGTNAGFSINGIGYRTADDFIYGMEMSNDHLIRLGNDGSFERLGAIDGLPPGSYYTGDFGHDGLLYVRHGNTMFGINVDTVAVERTIQAPGVSGTADIAYNPKTELYYSVRRQSGTTKTADFISVDLREGANLGKVTVISATLSPGGTYGAVFSEVNGRVFAANNAGGLYEINIETGTATFAGKTPAASSNDGAAPTNVAMNLPPVAEDAYLSTVEGVTDLPLNITRPTDLEGDAIVVQISSLPNLGTVRLGNTALQVGDHVSADDMTTLVYDAPTSYDGTADPGNMTYTVSDHEHTVVGTVEIQLSGYSQLAGRVRIVDTSDDGAWDGYAFHNAIQLSGYDRFGNTVSETTLTDLDGNFAFDGLLPGTYQLDQTQPEHVNDGFAETADQGIVRSTNRIGDIVIPLGTSARYDGFAFVEYAQSSLSGFVFIDENLNREVDVQEEGILNVDLRLTGTNDLGDSVSRTTTTDGYGYYEFGDLRPGVYSVMQYQPGDYGSVSEVMGTEGGTVTTNGFTNIQLAAGVDGQQYSFGEVEGGTISGSVFIDADIDRVFDAGDTGVADNTIRLTGVDYAGNSVERTDVTNSGGDYAFENVLPGTYTVTQTEQPKGLNEGRIANTISNLQLASGEVMYDRSFDERLNLELARRFDERVTLTGTEGDDIIDIVFATEGMDAHSITINGVEQTFAADRVTEFRLDALGGNDTITMTGTDGVEEVRMWSDSTRFHAETWKITADNAEDVHVEGGGGYDLAYLYGTKGNENVKGTEAYLRMIGDGFMNKASHFHRAKAYSGGGTNDRAYLYDSAKDDTVKMRHDETRMFSRKFNNSVVDFDRVYAYAQNGGTDHARFWDSPRANDNYQARDGFARMYNQGRFYNAATGFEHMIGIADQGGGNDRMFLYDTVGDDILVSTPRESGLTGEGYEIQGERFERVYAYATEGNDQAFLYDSMLNDVFVAEPDHARLYNNRFYLRANDFDSVNAYSSNGGRDRAYFRDSAGDDKLVALENEVRMTGDGFDNTSHGFSRAYVDAKNGGNDTAYLFDTDRADTVKVSGSNTRMYGRGYYTRVDSRFETIDVSFGDINARDRAVVFGVLDTTTVASAGGLAKIMTQYGASFIYDADGLQELHNQDENDDDGSTFLSLFNADELYEIPSAT